jgi:uncharacterized damage-inducible protein DinB
VNDLEFCIARRKAEAGAFARVLKAMPQDKLDYRPDPKARTAKDLAWMMAIEEMALLGVLEKGTCDWPADAPPATAEAMAAAYEKTAAAVTAKLEALDETGWRKKGAIAFGPDAKWEDTIANLAWGLLFDAIHHRGQLSTYLRPMGGKVPSIYGPSADDAGA